MIRPSPRYLVAAIVLGVVFTASLARAEGPCPSCPSNPKGERPSPPGDGERRFGCYTHANSDFSCGSLRSELLFIFGGCRSFFGEPCYKGPPGDGSCPPKTRCPKLFP